MQSAPVVSFIIVSWNVRDLLRKALISIPQYTQASFEIIVVDNASSDGSADMVRREFPMVVFIANSTNRGFAQANNQALQVATGEFVFFLNCDAELSSDVFATVREHFSRPDIAMVGPAIRNPDGTHQQSVRQFPQLSEQWIVLLKLRHFLRWTPPMRRYLADTTAAATAPVFVDQIMGAAMVARRSLIADIGGFDDGYPNWFEEVDLCARIEQRRWQILYDPRVSVMHHGNQSFGQVLSVTKHRWWLVGFRRYTDRFWPRWQRPIVRLLCIASYGLTIIQTLVKPR